MKYFYIIIIALCFTTSFCFSSEQIELSSRTGKTISFESREYFGLFPEIKDYESATLYKDISSNYFLVNTVKSEVKIPVSDSSIIALKFVIDNFEEIVRDYRIYKFSPNLLTGLIKVNFIWNIFAQPITVHLKDKSEFRGYLLSTDTTQIVIALDSTINGNSRYKIINYEDIYSISESEYPIIDGSKIVFNANLFSLRENYILINTANKAVVAPEINKVMIKHQKFESKIKVESPLDYDSLYHKKMSITFDCSIQGFNIYEFNSIKTCNNTMGYDPNTYQLYLENYYSYGINFGYRISKNIKFLFGYNLEKIDFLFSKEGEKNKISGNTLNLNLSFNLWHNKIYHFQSWQFFADVFFGTQVHQYSYDHDYIVSCRSIKPNDFTKSDIENSLRVSYKTGLNIEYKALNANILYLTLFVNYHNNFGRFSWSEVYYSRYIVNLFSFGFTFGAGIEF